MGRKKKEEELPITEIAEDVPPSDVEEDFFEEDLDSDYDFGDEEISDEDDE